MSVSDSGLSRDHVASRLDTITSVEPILLFCKEQISKTWVMFTLEHGAELLVRLKLHTAMGLVSYLVRFTSIMEQM